uniref:U-box domain-containing protein n=1 Tax=Rhizochromulina marina TaxID=1034831 RepID=A0A7S2WRM8_9STRA
MEGGETRVLGQQPLEEDLAEVLVASAIVLALLLVYLIPVGARVMLTTASACTSWLPTAVWLGTLALSVDLSGHPLSFVHPTSREALLALGPKHLLVALSLFSKPEILNNRFGLWSSPHAFWIWVSTTVKGRELLNILGLRVAPLSLSKAIFLYLFPYLPIASRCLLLPGVLPKVIGVYLSLRQLVHAARFVFTASAVRQRNFGRLYPTLVATFTSLAIRDFINMLTNTSHAFSWYFLAWSLSPQVLMANMMDWDRSVRDEHVLDHLLVILLPLLLLAEPAAIGSVIFNPDPYLNEDARLVEERLHFAGRRRVLDHVEDALANANEEIAQAAAAQGVPGAEDLVRLRSRPPLHWPAALAMSDTERKALDLLIDQNQAPRSILCTISHEVMEEPAIIHGHSYNRKSIEGWLRTNDFEPVSRLRCHISQLQPDYNMRDVIEFYLREVRSTPVTMSGDEPPTGHTAELSSFTAALGDASGLAALPCAGPGSGPDSAVSPRPLPARHNTGREVQEAAHPLLNLPTHPSTSTAPRTWRSRVGQRKRKAPTTASPPVRPVMPFSGHGQPLPSSEEPADLRPAEAKVSPADQPASDLRLRTSQDGGRNPRLSGSQLRKRRRRRVHQTRTADGAE